MSDDPGDPTGSEGYCMRLREQFGLRADLVWVREVAVTGQQYGMTLGIPLTPGEYADITDRRERSGRITSALGAVGLRADAGSWIDQRAGGIVHVLLADPSGTDLATARAALADLPAVVDPVALSLQELQRIQDEVRHAVEIDPELRAAWTSTSRRERENIVRVALLPGSDPAPAERLLDRTACRGIHITYEDHRLVRIGSVPPSRYPDEIIPEGRTSGVVQSWSDSTGRGVIDSPDTPGGCAAHYDQLDMDGFRTLHSGQTVRLEWEAPNREYLPPYIATRIEP